MNRIKGSVYIKILIHIALFLSGLTLAIGTYHIFNYLDSYTTNTSDFKETSEFQNKYLKYVERVAVYVDYREKGYSGSIGFDPSSSDISSLFEKEVDTKTKKKDNDASTEQQKFDYYNAILNQTNSNFLYYVKNIKTGAVYASAALENKVIKANDDGKNKMTLKEYLEHVKLTNNAYLIINTETEKYATNVNRNYQYLNDENLSWVIDYIKGNVINGEGDTEKDRGDYIICTTIVNNFPNKADEFGTMYHHFNSLYFNYSNSLHPVPISFIMLLLFLILTVFFTGHSKNSDEIILLGFDRLKTESSLILTAGGAALLYTAAIRLCKYLHEDYSFDYSILLGIGYAILYPFCMFALLSLVRRVKKNILISNSYLHSFGLKLKVFIREFFTGRSITFHFAGIIILFTIIETAGFLIYRYAFSFHYRIPIAITTCIFGYLFLFYLTIKQVIDFKIISHETKKLADGDLSHKIPIESMREPALSLALDINNISEGFSAAVDEKVKSERLKTELIANVSHDIKTPLTSIINYVDLLKKENLNNETAQGYLDILSGKTWRLKTLIEDLVEASKASSGALVLNLECLNLVELVRQSLGEFEDKFLDHKIEPVLTVSQEPLYIMADGRSTYRIIENIFSNVVKYALSGTRAYINIGAEEDMAVVSVKNISTAKLNISTDELMERFVRGDLSRNTEGSGLGLSIAKSLAAIQEGTFDIELDGDLFKAVLKFNKLNGYTSETRIAKESDFLP